MDKLKVVVIQHADGLGVDNQKEERYGCLIFCKIKVENILGFSLKNLTEMKVEMKRSCLIVSISYLAKLRILEVQPESCCGEWTNEFMSCQ